MAERPATMSRDRSGGTLAALRARRLGRSAGSARQPGSPCQRAGAERLAPLLEALGRAQAAPAPDGVPFRVRFAGNVQGLAVGAPVTVRGLRVGTVREVAVTFDSGTGQLDVPVVIDIVPGSLVVDGQRAASPAEVRRGHGDAGARGGCAPSWRAPACCRRTGRWRSTCARRHRPPCSAMGRCRRSRACRHGSTPCRRRWTRCWREVGKLPLDRLAARSKRS